MRSSLEIRQQSKKGVTGWLSSSRDTGGTRSSGLPRARALAERPRRRGVAGRADGLARHQDVRGPRARPRPRGSSGTSPSGAACGRSRRAASSAPACSSWRRPAAAASPRPTPPRRRARRRRRRGIRRRSCSRGAARPPRRGAPTHSCALRAGGSGGRGKFSGTRRNAESGLAMSPGFSPDVADERLLHERAHRVRASRAAPLLDALVEEQRMAARAVLLVGDRRHQPRRRRPLRAATPPVASFRLVAGRALELLRAGRTAQRVLHVHRVVEAEPAGILRARFHARRTPG